MLESTASSRIKNRQILDLRRGSRRPRHRWYFVKEGFAPNLVEDALRTEGVKKGELLVDPFAGGGTVPLSGAVAGVRVEACEVNPFLRFVSSTKLARADPEETRSVGRAIHRAMEYPKRSNLEGYSTFTPGNRWKRWLFPVSVIRAFEAGKRAALDVDDEATRSVLMLALIAATMDCCNATRDGKCLRFRAGWEQRESSGAQVRRQFELRVAEIVEDLHSVCLDEDAGVILEGDAREILGRQKTKFRLCVTSPPYLNSFDYSDVYRPELFLGGFVSSTAELMAIRLKAIRSHLQANWPDPKSEEFGATYRKSMDKLADGNGVLWNRRLLTMIQAYFEDMDGILRQLFVRAESEASMWLVVSTSAYGGIEVPVDTILADVGQRAGWFLREVRLLRHLRSSSQHMEHVEDKARKAVPLRESVIVLDASRRE